MVAAHPQLRTVSLAALALAAANLVSVALVREYPQVAPLWVGTGLTVGLLLVAPKRHWPHLTCLFVAVCATVRGLAGDSLQSIAGLVAAGVGEVLLVAGALAGDRGWIEGEHERTAAWLRFVAFGGVVGPALAAVIGALVLGMDRAAPFLATCLSLYIAHAMATCALVPLLLRYHGSRSAARKVGQPRLRVTMNDEIYRTIARDSGEMILVGDDMGHNEYVSPATSEILGIAASELRGLGWQRFMPHEDVELLMAAVARLRAGDREAVCMFRVRAHGGEIRWLETRCRRSRPAPGRNKSYVIWTARDVTAHKQRQQELEEEKRVLEAMAGTDALTGLPNRRRFDEIWQREWLRARREDSPISLLVVDVDYFKRFNDTYGHVAGDRCLAAIAAAAAAAMRRPADLCARLGGEEFVVVLPGTDGPGAWHVAEAIRRGVAELQIVHRHNDSGDGGFVTVSVGVATCERPFAEDGAALLEEADRRLYRAKAEGRNRVAVRP